MIPAAVDGLRVVPERINRFLDPKRLRWLAIGASTFGRCRADRPRVAGDLRGGDVTQEPSETPDIAVRKVKSAVRTVELLEYLAARPDPPGTAAGDQ